MNKNFYFSHPIEASLDPRMEAMEEKLHGKGAGVYWYIREKMSFFSDNRCRLRDLKPFATRYYTYRLMERVVLETELFDYDGEYITPRKLKCEQPSDDLQPDPEPSAGSAKPLRKTASENTRKTAKNTRKTTKKDENPSIFDEKTMISDEKTTKIVEKTMNFDEKIAENEEKQPENDVKTAENSPKMPVETPCNVAKPSDNEQITALSAQTNNTNTSIYIKKEKEKQRKITTTTPPMKKQEVRPDPTPHWQRYVDGLDANSEWAEMVCVKSGFGQLLRKHFAYAKELFRQHVITFGKETNLTTPDDAKRYFASYVLHDVTSKVLKQRLMEKDRGASSPADTRYRYEQRLGGRRIYNGRPIPDDAPPRPDNHSIWNRRLGKWEEEYG